MPSEEPQPSYTLSSNVRSIISLLLFMHLFCVFFCIFSVYEPSRFQQRMLGVLAPYTQTMNIDLDFAPYYLTRDLLSEPTFDVFQEREYRVEVLPDDGDPNDPQAWVKLGEQWWGAGEPYRRLQRLGYLPIGSAAEERQSAVALNLAKFGEQQIGKPVRRVRVRQHVPVPQVYVEEEVPFDVNEEVWFRTSYQAIIIGDSVLPVVPENEAAPLTPTDSASN